MPFGSYVGRRAQKIGSEQERKETRIDRTQCGGSQIWSPATNNEIATLTGWSSEKIEGSQAELCEDRAKRRRPNHFRRRRWSLEVLVGRGPHGRFGREALNWQGTNRAALDRSSYACRLPLVRCLAKYQNLEIEQNPDREKLRFE
ncbi:hypothetical protein H5410_062836 [Solanum commersonii]|uniref:Uncharacterized protein n=1 Tax=Solanum commersonii TaxID=4109 RepID=A0A9J5WDW0_SOLCO|nr:hypothetical protein H5410_062836 [Solanum commersonii]